MNMGINSKLSSVYHIWISGVL